MYGHGWLKLVVCTARPIFKKYIRFWAFVINEIDLSSIRLSVCHAHVSLNSFLVAFFLTAIRSFVRSLDSGGWLVCLSIKKIHSNIHSFRRSFIEQKKRNICIPFYFLPQIIKVFNRKCVNEFKILFVREKHINK